MAEKLGVDEGPHERISGETFQEASPELHHNTLCARCLEPSTGFSPIMPALLTLGRQTCTYWPGSSSAQS